MKSGKIRVMAVDDSAMIREFLRVLFEKTPDIELVAAANDPLFARDKFMMHRPDVIVLDVEMPRMDGITFLKKLMSAHPTPVVMFSSYTQAGAEATLTALALGAVDFVAKPTQRMSEGLSAVSEEIIDKVRNAAGARVGKAASLPGALETPGRMGADQIIPLVRERPPANGEMVVLLGASTGGTVTLEHILTRLPADSPPIAVVQHMPLQFTRAFAQRLDSLCGITVSEASDFQPLTPGQAIIAPGGKHMLLEKGQQGYFLRIKDGPPVNRHKPSVDVLFRSAANSAGSDAVAVIMTGMGDDGAKGMLDLHKAGALTLAQDEASCTIYGMPRAAVSLGAVDKIIPLDNIASFIEDLWQRSGELAAR